MSVTIEVNGLSLCHKGSNGISTATVPDVCKTPSPGGPVPLPYPNISMSSDLENGSTTVKADGGNMIAIKGSDFSRSTGDEPGTVGGVKSNVNMKESKWLLYSFDVKIDGANACRLTDKKTQNHENTFDAAGLFQDPLRNEAGEAEEAEGLKALKNQLPGNLAAETAEMEEAGVSPISPGDPAFEELANSGQMKWVVTEDGQLLVAPYEAGVEISHAAIAGGESVLGAGTANVAVAEGETVGISIDAMSGHYLNGASAEASASALKAGIQAFAQYGITFF